MLSIMLGREKYQFQKSLIWLDREPNSRSPTCEDRALLIQSLRANGDDDDDSANNFIVDDLNADNTLNFSPIKRNVQI